MAKRPTRCATTHKEGILGDEEATFLYQYLESNIKWQEGIRSSKGFTRKAAALRLGDEPLIDEAITLAVSVLAKCEYQIDGIYLNYYQDGEMWTPNHTHAGTHQIVISLGAERVLTVAKKDYIMKNGSAIIFGSATHGVPKCDIKEGRISIATFMTPIA